MRGARLRETVHLDGPVLRAPDRDPARGIARLRKGDNQMTGKFLAYAGAAIVGGLVLVAPVSATRPQASFGFNGTVSGFPTGAVFLTGGGAYNLASGFVHSAGGFRCLEDVEQVPLAGWLAGEGIRRSEERRVGQ